MRVECWQRGHLIAVHKCSDELTHKEVLQRFGLNDLWTVRWHPEGRPDILKTIQTEKSRESSS